METQAGHLTRVAFADTATATTDIQIFKPGKFRKGGRNLEIGPKQFEQAIANFDAKVAGELPLDFDHSFAVGGTSKAAGWYKRLFQKDGGLWATVEFTVEAAQAVRDGTFRFFSPEFHTNWPDETGKQHGFTVLAGGLTNRPFLRNMAPITLSDEITVGELGDLEINFVLSDDASERVREMGILTKDKPEATSDAQTVETLTARVAELEPLADQVTTLTTERDALQTQLEAAESGKGDAEKELVKLSDRLETLEKTTFAKDRDAVIAKHTARGAIDTKDDTVSKWHTRAEKHGVAFIDDLLTDIPDEAAVQLSVIGHGGDANTSTAPNGVDPASFALNARAEAIALERKISYEDAVDIAVREGVTA